MEDKIGEIGTCLDGIKQSIKDGEYIELYDKLTELRELQEQEKIPVKCWKHIAFCVNDNSKLRILTDDVVLHMTQEDYDRAKEVPRFSSSPDGEIDIYGFPLRISFPPKDNLIHNLIHNDVFIVHSYYTLRH